MRINWANIRLIVLFFSVLFLCSFSLKRNGNRVVSNPEIIFQGENVNLFITQGAVSRLLKKNESWTKGLTKNGVDLFKLENVLVDNPIIEEAQVYINVDGNLTAEVKQKQPIARVNAEKQFYIDSNGGYMPLSKNYTARVPFVTGVTKTDSFDKVFKIINKINSDRFLKKQVVEIIQTPEKAIQLKLRQANFTVNVGELDYLDKKVSNLKAFFVKAKKDNVLGHYKLVNLQFDNQVVCTKI